METIIVKPKTEKELNFFKEFFEKVNAETEYKNQTETLEEKILKLYEQEHYTDTEIKMFFEIPKKYRVDPFKLSPSGDVYFADKRNIDELESDLIQGEKDFKQENYVEFDIHSLRESIREFSRKNVINE